ncbi:DUF4179 domain-containing protein [Inconstantimicrobium porci]|uniref:DUF4179 domain-containing protein n=1 Tax=Inconstantimicrobium porci TaxID=2652291 RepID=A0A7X2N124_9CLOT|nr:DUF4179 domain-containing protein [Inconstantimicrobium porci]MSR92300.1 DUF4179 domain-containing protein [Inconstantimicrobium porci]
MDNLENELLNLGKENVEMPKSVRTKVDLSYHIIRNSEKRKSHKKWVAVAAILVTSLTVATAMTPQAQASIKHFMENFGVKAVTTAADNGYIQKTSSSVKSGKNIDMSLNSIVLDSNSLVLDFKVKYKNDEYNKKYYDIGLLPNIEVTDNNNTIIYSDSKPYSKDRAFAGGDIATKLQSDGIHFIMSLGSTNISVPDLSQLKINISSISAVDSNDNSAKRLFDEKVNWSFETTVDKKFKQNTDIMYKLKDDSAPIEIVSAKLTPTGFTISYKDKQNKNSNAEDIGSSFLTANNKMYPVTSSSDKDGIITADFNNISSFDKCGDITFNLQYFSQDGIKKIVLVK